MWNGYSLNITIIIIWLVWFARLRHEVIKLVESNCSVWIDQARRYGSASSIRLSIRVGCSLIGSQYERWFPVHSSLDDRKWRMRLNDSILPVCVCWSAVNKMICFRCGWRFCFVSMHSDESCSLTSYHLPYTCHAHHFESIGYHTRWRATARHGRVNQIGRTSFVIRFLSCSLINKLAFLESISMIRTRKCFWNSDRSLLEKDWTSIVRCEPCGDRERLSFIWSRYVWRCFQFEFERLFEERIFFSVKRSLIFDLLDDTLKMSAMDPSSTGAGILNIIHPHGAELNTGRRDHIPATSMFPTEIMTVGGSNEFYYMLCANVTVWCTLTNLV